MTNLSKEFDYLASMIIFTLQGRQIQNRSVAGECFAALKEDSTAEPLGGSQRMRALNGVIFGRGLTGYISYAFATIIKYSAN